jgi:hypothetical protein
VVGLNKEAFAEYVQGMMLVWGQGYTDPGVEPDGMQRRIVAINHPESDGASTQVYEVRTGVYFTDLERRYKVTVIVEEVD